MLFEAYTVMLGKFLQWMWFLEATFTPHLSELHHHKMVLPDDKKVPEVRCGCSNCGSYNIWDVMDQRRTSYACKQRHVFPARLTFGAIISVTSNDRVTETANHL